MNTLCLNNPKVDINRLKNVKIANTECYCEIIFEDLERYPYVDIHKLCNCEYDIESEIIKLEDGTRIHTLKCCYGKLVLKESINKYQVFLYGVFPSKNDLQNYIKEYSRNLDKSFNRIYNSIK